VVIEEPLSCLVKAIGEDRFWVPMTRPISNQRDGFAISLRFYDGSLTDSR
jgi:hypothetical protein